MQAKPQVAIVVRMTLDEARMAVVNSTDIMLAIRSALYQLEPAQTIEVMAAKTRKQQLTASSNGKKPRKRSTKQCEACGKDIGVTGFGRHMKAHRRAELAATEVQL